MIELIDTSPHIAVQPAEYQRLLGYPRDRLLDERATELADGARAWYARHGRPWVYARQARNLDITNGSIAIDGVSFTSPRLQETLFSARADSAIVVAVSAGPELEAEAQRRWQEEKPDEYFFLEIYGSAVVEHLVTTTGARLCAWAEAQGVAVLPHYSPGYPEWDVAEQGRLLELIRRTRDGQIPGPLAALESGMLRPKKSLLAVFGLTRQTAHVRRLTDLVPCESCSFAPCEFRRAPYRRSAAYVSLESVPVGAGDNGETREETSDGQPALVTTSAEAAWSPLDLDAKYATNVRALRRWADERLSLDENADGSIAALFRYEGRTCGNVELRFDYHVTLGPRGEGYRVRGHHCVATAGDDGYTEMCQYRLDGDKLLAEIAADAPLLGQPLNDVLAWRRPLMSPACYCDADSRVHKWGLVLETIHLALAQREPKTATTAAAPPRATQEAGRS